MLAGRDFRSGSIRWLRPMHARTVDVSASHLPIQQQQHMKGPAINLSLLVIGLTMQGNVVVF